MKRKIRITIIPHNTSPMRHKEISPILFGFIIVVILSPIVIYTLMRKTEIDLATLKNENTFLEENVNWLEREEGKLKERQNRLKNQCKSIRSQWIGNTEREYLNREIDISSLTREVQEEKLLTEMIEKKLKLDNGIERCIPSISPTKGWIIRNFGYVRDEFTGRYKFCAGIDIASTKGTKVYATANGKVQFAGRKKNAGLMVVINHGHGFKTTYSHLSRLSVKRWKYIKRGTPIGYVGKTGKVEGPRLHYEVYVNEKPVNPLSFIPNGIESL